MNQLKDLASPAVTRVYTAYERGSQANMDLWWHTDTSVRMELDEVQRKVDKMIQSAKAQLKTALEGVLSDGKEMKEIYRGIQWAVAMDAVTATRDDIDRVVYIREQQEDPQDQARLLELLKEAAGVLGVADEIEIELLRPEDYVLLGAQGLYTRRKEGKPIVSVPMSDYENGDLLDLSKIFEIFAHEVAHHQVRELDDESLRSFTGNRDHNLFHTAMTERNMQRLRGASPEPVFEEETGTVTGIRLVHPENFYINAKAQEGDVAHFNAIIDETFRFLGAENQSNVHTHLTPEGNLVLDTNKGYILPRAQLCSVEAIWDQILHVIIRAKFEKFRDATTGILGELPDDFVKDFPEHERAPYLVSCILKERYMSKLKRADSGFAAAEPGSTPTFFIKEASTKGIDRIDPGARVTQLNPADRALMQSAPQVTAELRDAVAQATGLKQQLTAIVDAAKAKKPAAAQAQGAGLGTWLKKVFVDEDKPKK